VFFDAFVVRMTIMPAVLVLLRERAWWLPAWLDRLLPNMDVEGANLEHRVAGREAALAEGMATSI
jgi:RND superfamily putative drug exporter